MPQRLSEHRSQESGTARQRWLLLGAGALVWVALTGCGAPRAPSDLDEAASAAATPGDPGSRLGDLLRRGAQPGGLSLEQQGEVESLILQVLPEAAGDLDGHRWRVTYIDLPRAGFVAIDLMEEEGDAAPRAAWFHLFYRSPQAAPSEPYSERLGPYPARHEPGELLFVQAGRVELRAVPESDRLEEPGRLEELVQAFDLELLASF
jgi:hypothetical protein